MALPPRAADMSESIPIFQDAFYSHQSTPMISHAPMPSGTKPAQRRLAQTPTDANVLRNTASNGNVIINPPLQPASRPSPTKMAAPFTPSPFVPLQPAQTNNKLNMVTFKPPVAPKPAETIPKKQPSMSRFKAVAQKPPSVDGLPTVGYMGKENNHMAFPGAPGMSLSIENYYHKAPGKRLLEAPSIKDSRPIKKLRLDDGPLPSHDSFPPIVDDGLKPGHSYAMLIGMAILRTPTRKLTLAQIYKWISDTFSFYSPQDAGWQNSIRHNLSLNKAFLKQERPKDDPGKGNYWAIEPGMEHLFMKDKPGRKPNCSSDGLQGMTTTVMEPSLPPMPSSFHEPALPPMPSLPIGITEPSMSSMPAMATPQVKKQVEPSSDATIIASESGTPERATTTTSSKPTTSLPTVPEHTDPTLLDSCLYSPIHATALHSSPPISRHIDTTSGTPPPVLRAPLASSVNRSSRKRKSTSVDDSGYISSLESSALRNSRHLPSEGIDRSRIKRGRAEEEIARLRASSYDSPTKNRSRMGNGFQPPSSSPLRNGQNENGSMLPPPLTPAVKLRAAPKPPPSVSPGTNLRMHRAKVRHMLASPTRRISSATDDVTTWGSPTAFDESLYNFTDEVIGGFSMDSNSLGSGFEIFQDDSLPNLFPAMHNGSPVKPPSSKRPRIDRSQSACALSEVTNSAQRRSITSAPLLRAPAQSPSVQLDTPSKFFEGLPSSPSKFFLQQSPTKMPPSTLAGPPLDPGVADENACFQLDDFCTPEFIQDVEDFGGMDILQGFEKIGSNTALFSMPPAQPQLMPYSQPQPLEQHHQFQIQRQPHFARPAKASQKSAMGRSYTTTF